MSEQSDAVPQAENADALDDTSGQLENLNAAADASGEQDDSEAEGSEPADKEQAPEGSGKPDPKLAKMAYENRELKRQLAEIEANQRKGEIDSLEAELDSPKTVEDFAGDQKAYAKYLIGLGQKADKLQQLTEAAQAAEQQNLQADAPPGFDYAATEETFAVQADDYYEVAYDPTLPVSQTMAQAIRGMEQGPEVLYFLGKNPERAGRISKLPDFAQAGALRALAQTLPGHKAKADTSDASSKAPPPADELKTSASPNSGLRAVSASDPKSDELSDEEWARRRNKELAKRRQR